MQDLPLGVFTDSVDDDMNYGIRLCSDKTFQLDNTTPGFLTVSQDMMGVVTLHYDQSNAVTSDIMTHTINYLVRNSEYSGITSIPGSFDFTIRCPTSVESSSLVTPIGATTLNYDVKIDGAVSKTLP